MAPCGGVGAERQVKKHSKVPGPSIPLKNTPSMMQLFYFFYFLMIYLFLSEGVGSLRITDDCELHMVAGN